MELVRNDRKRNAEGGGIERRCEGNNAQTDKSEVECGSRFKTLGRHSLKEVCSPALENLIEI